MGVVVVLLYPVVLDGVVAVPAVQVIGAVPAVDEVVARAAIDLVVTGSPADHVVPTLAEDELFLLVSGVWKRLPQSQRRRAYRMYSHT